MENINENSKDIKKETKEKELSIVVPCYNEEESILIYFDTVKLVLNNIYKQYNIKTNLIFVDDGSSDKTNLVVSGLKKNLDDENLRGFIKVHLITFSRNYGKEAAMLAGFNKAYEIDSYYTSIMDIDLQDPPRLLEKMVDMLENESRFNQIAAVRTTRKNESKFRAFLSSNYYKVFNFLSGVKMKRGLRDFRVVRKSVLEKVVSMSEKTRFTKAIFEFVDQEIEFLEYPNEERKAGESSWSTFGLLKYAVDSILSFSAKPLQIISYFAAIMSLLIFLVGVSYVVFMVVFGFVPIVISIIYSCLFGVMAILILMTLAFILQYVSKIYVESKNRPLYYVNRDEIL